MPTKAGRERYACASIRLFGQQTFPDAELVVLSDEHNRDIALAAASVPRVRYNWAGSDKVFGSTGEKRNAVNALAEGRIIIHWDDDDWYSVDRIARQVGHLISSGMQLVGFHDLLYYLETTGALYRYRYAGRTPYAAGTSQCYWYNYWQANKFTPVQRGEDSQFSLRASGQKVLASCDSSGMVVARAHADCKLTLGGHDFPAAERALFPQAFFDAEKP